MWHGGKYRTAPDNLEGCGDLVPFKDKRHRSPKVIIAGGLRSRGAVMDQLISLCGLHKLENSKCQ